jgi:protein-S-isoprenylcysteine O-methyltransferase Ste14
MIERISAYVLLVSFFLLESFLRKDKTAKSIEKSSSDNKSTVLILLTFFVVLVLSIILNLFHFGLFNSESIAITGIAVMITGILIRIHSMLTLSKFYTRTLITVDNQELVKKGLYKLIRHPGYLGTILIWSGAGLAMQNEIIFLVGTLLVIIAYYYRIDNEEKMLIGTFGQKYSEYKKTTWRLVPLIW